MISFRMGAGLLGAFVWLPRPRKERWRYDSAAAVLLCCCYRPWCLAAPHAMFPPTATATLRPAGQSAVGFLREEVKHSKCSSLSRWCFIVSTASVLLGVLSFFRAVSFAADQIVLASSECARVGRGETAINANHSSLITLGYVLRKGAQSNW